MDQAETQAVEAGMRSVYSQAWNKGFIAGFWVGVGLLVAAELFLFLIFR